MLFGMKSKSVTSTATDDTSNADDDVVGNVVTTVSKIGGIKTEDKGTRGMPVTARAVTVTDKARKTIAARLTLQCGTLVKLLQIVSGVIERRQTMPILANVLLIFEGNTLTVTSADSEIELIGKVALGAGEEAVNFTPITLPGRKLLDICRALPGDSNVEIICDAANGRVTLTSGHSRFVLTTLPADEFPLIPTQKSIVELKMSSKVLRSLAEKTCFAIPQQDARSYLNGMLMEIKEGIVQAVASDAARLALSAAPFTQQEAAFAQVIIPRKAIVEMIRLLPTESAAGEGNAAAVASSVDEEENITVGLNSNYIRVTGENFGFTSKLIAGKYPNYNNLLPKGGNKKIIINRHELKQALLRINILSHEVLHSFRLILEDSILRLLANNPEQEEAVEELVVDYVGEKLEIAFNIGYFLDILNNISADKVAIIFKNGDSGAIIKSTAPGDGDTLYVLMPILK